MEKIKERIEELKKEYQALAKEMTAEIFINFFEKYPFAKGVAWNQGTPGFCDGGPCSFHVYSYETVIIVSNELLEKLEEESGFSGFYGEEVGFYKGYGDGSYVEGEYYEALNEAIHIVDNLDEELCRDSYGDSVTVIMLREGVTQVEDWDGPGY